jgi:hypothetical protein
MANPLRAWPKFSDVSPWSEIARTGTVGSGTSDASCNMPEDNSLCRYAAQGFVLWHVEAGIDRYIDR